MMTLIDGMMMLLMVVVMVEWLYWNDDHCAGPWSEQSTIAFKHRENAHRTGPSRSGDFDIKIMVSIFLLPSIIVLLGKALLEQLDLICHLRYYLYRQYAYLHVPFPLNWPNMLIVSGNIFLRRGTFSERSCRSTWGTTLSALVEEGRSTRLVSLSQGLGGRRVHQVKIRS